MGLTHVDEAISLIDGLVEAGYYVIVNESINVNDGGVSGVRWNDVVEFAPKDTPRCVERPGVAGLPRRIADTLFKVIYGQATPLPSAATRRLEFSIHTSPVGLKRELAVCWEIDARASESMMSTDRILPIWPNRFSEFIGDKTFGLLLAHLYGFRVPRTLAMTRDVAPFEFGARTGTNRVWTRTAPRGFAAGEYPTERGYSDPFRMMKEADPSGDMIGAILIQDEVDAANSGAVSLTDGTNPSVYGVAGFGDEFMMGTQEAARLPRRVKNQALTTYRSLARFFGPVRFEWVVDRKGNLWVVQLNLDAGTGFNLLAGGADHWVHFDPTEGVEALGRLIDELRGSETGVILTKAVGLTSHIGDILRREAVPVRVSAVHEQLKLWE
jgi:hypothetical protein